MKQPPKISVIIPTYNRSKIVKKTILSVLNQTVNDIEIIIVDDYSKDIVELKIIIESFNDTRIKLIVHESNRHGSAARNTGILVAKGQYIALLDSDDLWEENKLAQCLSCIKHEKNVIYSQFVSKGEIFPKRSIKKKEAVGDYLLIEKQSIQTSTLFMARSFAKQVLFDESLVRFQDYDFTIRLCACGAEFTMLPEVLVKMLDDDDGQRISNSVDFVPAMFWLTKISNLLSKQAKKTFYLHRVVRLMVIGGNQDKIFEQMPKEIRKELSYLQFLQLILFRLLPNWLWHLVRKIYRYLKA